MLQPQSQVKLSSPPDTSSGECAPLDAPIVMFRFQGKTRDIITLFHRPNVASSVRVSAFLKQVSAQASETATEDQVGDHSHQNKLQRRDFELDITEDPPTSDQLRTLLEYVGEQKAGQVVEGAKDAAEAMKNLKADGHNFKAPVVVDWYHGRAVVGDNKSEILELLAKPPK